MDRTVIKHYACVLRRLGVKSYDTQNGSIFSIIQMEDAGRVTAVRQSIRHSAHQVSCYEQRLLATRAGDQKN